MVFSKPLMQAVWTADGNLVCLGRTDGIFISGGENIHPFEIENHLLAMEDVVAAFVVPVPHREFGKVPWAFVETSAPFDEEHDHRLAQRPGCPATKSPNGLFVSIPMKKRRR